MKNFRGKEEKKSSITKGRKFISSCLSAIMMLEMILPTAAIAASNNLGETSTVNTGDYKDFSYKGYVETFVVPATGKYKLEVWGAEGGAYDSDSAGGDGGYSSGEVLLNKNDELYICVGGKGGTGTTRGYNGGGSGTVVCGNDSNRGGAGGGATHIAIGTNRGELKEYASNQNEVLIVAGGGGGASESADAGGNGGGTSGEESNRFLGGSGTGEYPGLGATHDAGGAAGNNGDTSSEAGSFGKGGDANNGSSKINTYGCGGGGGGWYGGGAAIHNKGNLVGGGGKSKDASGGGGSGHISDSITLIASAEEYNTGDGKAKITLLEVEPDVEITAVYNNGNTVIPNVVVKIGDRTLSESEYSYTYTETTNAGDIGTVSILDKEGGDYILIPVDKDFTVTKKTIEKPSKRYFEYDGEIYKIESVGDYCQYYTMTGEIHEQVIGEYTATVSLKDKDNTMWQDNTTDDFSYSWEIISRKIQVEWTQDTYVYDKTEKAPTVTTPVEVVDGEIVYITRTTFIEAGEHISQATITNVENGTMESYELINDTINYNINAKPLTDISISAQIDEDTFTYNGEEHNPQVISVIDNENGETDLVEGTDYEISYLNNINAGTGIVRLSGKGNYTGQKDIEFTINKKRLTNPTIELSQDEYIYDGSEKEPEVTVKDGNTVLVQDTDYEIEYFNNINSGTATIIVDGKGNYEITDSKTFEILKKEIPIPEGNTNLVYDGTTKSGVQENEWYVLEDNEKIDAGEYTAAATLKDIQNTIWEDGTIRSKDIDWTINPYTISVEWGNPRSFTYDKEGHAPDVTTPVDGVNEERVYITRTTQINAGNYESTASIANVENGREKISNYVLSSETMSFDINAKQIDDASISINLSETVYNYNGSSHEPEVTVTDSENGVTTLTKDVDYTLTYRENINAGTASAVITGINNYIGENTAEFTINKVNAVNPTISSTSSQYTNSEVFLNVTGGEGGTIYYKTSEDNINWSEWEETLPSRINAGTTYVKAYVEPDSNHNEVAETESYTLIVGKRTLGVIANHKEKYVGEDDPQLDFTYSNNIQGQTPAFTGSLARDVGEGIGSYSILQNDLSLIDNEEFKANNYEILYIRNTLTIKGAGIEGFEVEYEDSGYVYNGSQHTPQVVVRSGNNVLVANTDYDVEYKNNINAGTAEITITGKGNYSGEIKKYFEIGKKDAEITAVNKFKTYGENDPELTYTVQGVLDEDIASLNITVTREAGENANTYIETVSIGNAENQNYNLTLNNGIFTINSKNIVARIELSKYEYLYNGQEHKPEVEVYDNENNTLVPQEEYNVEYTSNIESGTAQVIISDVVGGNYIVSGTKNFEIIATTNIKINDLEENAKYYNEVEFTVTSDKTIDTVTDNGEVIEPVAGKYKISQDNKAHKIIATDVLGGRAEVNIFVYKTYTVRFIADDVVVETKENVKHGSSIEQLPLIPHKEGYDEVAPVWDKDLTNITSNLDVIAVYTKNEAGKIEKEDTQNYGNAKIENADEKLNDIIPFTEEEEHLIETGKNAKIYLEVKNAENSITEEEKNLIEKTADSNEVIVYKFLEINLYKEVAGNEPVKITKTNNKIRISIDIPEELINKDENIIRTYKIIRMHNGKISLLPAELENGKLYFETDEFSTYAVAYTDKTKETTKEKEENKEVKETEKTSNPKTRDSIRYYIISIFASILILKLTAYKKTKKNKHYK